jgi:hypothetical protein
MPKWFALSRRSVAVGVVVVAGGALLTAAGFGAQQVGHPPPQIQSMGEIYECDGGLPLSRTAAQTREFREGTLHVVGWVPMTHAVYAVHKAAPDVYVRFGSRYFPCLVSRSEQHEARDRAAISAR